MSTPRTTGAPEWDLPQPSAARSPCSPRLPAAAARSPGCAGLPAHVGATSPFGPGTGPPHGRVPHPVGPVLHLPVASEQRHTQLLDRLLRGHLVTSVRDLVGAGRADQRLEYAACPSGTVGIGTGISETKNTLSGAVRSTILISICWRRLRESNPGSRFCRLRMPGPPASTEVP